MEIYLLSFLVILLLVGGMSVGVIFADKPIKGSCGGMSALGMKTDCDICGGDKDRCEKEKARLAEAGSDLAYDATEKDS